MISELLKLFKATAARFGFPEWLVNEIVFLLVLLGFVFFVLRQLYKALKWFFLWNNQRKLNRDLHPYYSKSDVERTTKYFIPVKHQSVAPSIDAELGSSYISSPKEELIPFFLKKAFKNDKDDNKYYLILADSGMGKTTFMINLYIRYKNAFRLPFAPQKYDIKLFPLGYPNILEDIDKVKDKENTIL